MNLPLVIMVDKTRVDTENVVPDGTNGKNDRPVQSFPYMSDLNCYTLLSCDTLGALVTHIKLRAENYDQWSLSFIDSLRAKWKDYFIDGTMKIPNRNLPEYADWATMNMLIVSWIFVTLDSSLLPYVPYQDNAKDL